MVYGLHLCVCFSVYEYIYEYMCAICMQYLWRPEEGLRSRTGVQIVVSHPGMQTQVLCKSHKCL